MDNKEGIAKRKEELLEALRIKKEREQRALKAVERMILQTDELVITPTELLTLLGDISRSHYRDATEERAITFMCGYPLCQNALSKVPKQKYKISTRSNTVYDITERKNFCTNMCFKSSKFVEAQLPDSPVWLRAEEERQQQFQLLGRTDRGPMGDAIELTDDVRQQIAREIQSLAVSDGGDQQLQANDNVKPAANDDNAIASGDQPLQVTAAISNNEVAIKSIVKTRRSDRNCDEPTETGEERQRKVRFAPAVVVSSEEREDDSNRADEVRMIEDSSDRVAPAVKTEADAAVRETVSEKQQTTSSFGFHKEGTAASHQVDGIESNSSTKPKSIFAKKHRVPNFDRSKNKADAVRDTISETKAEPITVNAQSGEGGGIIDAVPPDNRRSLVLDAEASLRDWMTPATLVRVLGSQAVSERARVIGLSEAKLAERSMRVSTSSSPANRADFEARYVALCRRLDEAEAQDSLEDDALLAAASAVGAGASMVDDGQPLRVRAFVDGAEEDVAPEQLATTAVHAPKRLDSRNFKFRRGNKQKKKIRGDSTPQQNATGANEAENDTTSATNEAASSEHQLPLLDEYSQTALRKKVLVERLSRPLADVCGVLQLHERNVLAQIRSLVATFQLSARNVNLRPSSLPLVILVLVKLLSLSDAELASALRRSSDSLAALLSARYDLDHPGYLDRAAEWLLDMRYLVLDSSSLQTPALPITINYRNDLYEQ